MRKEEDMKKIILAMLLVLLVVMAVACGGETETTPAETTPAVTDGTTSGSEGEQNPPDPADTSSEAPESTEPPLYEEGINIMNGDPDYMAIEPWTFNSSFAVSFEDFHEALDFQWALVFRMMESVEGVYEQLISTIEDVEEGQDNFVINNQYKWVVEINKVDYPVQKFSVLNDTTSGWVRLGLGEEYEPAEGNNAYDIRLKIYDEETNELAFWAWMTNPELSGQEFKFNRPSADGKVADPNVNFDEVELFDSEHIIIISGPSGSVAESYPNLFDKDVRTKLCTDDVTTPVMFVINDTVTSFNLKSISIIGANDDDAYDSRIIKSFKLYGTNTEGEDAVWNLICDGKRDSVEAVNYQERNYELSKDSSYRFYKLEFVHDGTYQVGEIQLFAEKDSIILAK